MQPFKAIDFRVPDVSFNAPTNTWVAWSEATETVGFGDDAQAAVADYWDNLRELHDRLIELGRERVSARLWAMLPALRQALDIES